MARGHQDSRDDKINTALKARLDRLEPQQTVPAIVLLGVGGVDGTSGRRQSPAERQAAIEAMRKSIEPALTEIDSVLERFGGRRMAAGVNALGAIPVETTAAGIAALAELEPVKAIFEDQPISPLPRSK
jgi:hypothetical protein